MAERKTVNYVGLVREGEKSARVLVKEHQGEYWTVVVNKRNFSLSSPPVGEWVMSGDFEEATQAQIKKVLDRDNVKSAKVSSAEETKVMSESKIELIVCKVIGVVAEGKKSIRFLVEYNGKFSTLSLVGEEAEHVLKLHMDGDVDVEVMPELLEEATEAQVNRARANGCKYKQIQLFKVEKPKPEKVGMEVFDDL